MMDFKEFDNELKKRVGKGHKNFRITHSFGVYDAYKHIRKNHWYNIGRPVTEKEFYAVIRGVNKMLASEIALGNEVVFPCQMGRLELRKHERGVSIVDGKLKNTYAIDWASTFRLWFEDEEEREKKTLLRRSENVGYYVKYCKGKAKYNNKKFYQFQINRFIKLAIRDNIKKGITDALWQDNYS